MTHPLVEKARARVSSPLRAVEREPRGRDFSHLSGQERADAIVAAINRGETIDNQKTFEGEPYPVLSPPLITLFVTPAEPEASRTAFDLLQASNDGFQVEPAPDDRVAVEWAGKTHYGVPGVEKLLYGLKRMDEIFEPLLKSEEMKPLYNPKVGAQAARELAEQMADAMREYDAAMQGAGIPST